MDNCAIISLKDVLMELCHETLWKYAIYWRLDYGPHQVLAWEDGYVDTRKLENGLIDFEEGNSVYFCSIEQILADMSQRLFSVGEGIIGEVALIGQHKWIFPEIYDLDMLYKLPEDWQRQYLAGIKTILLVPIGNFGVLQLGSLHMVCEDHNLVSKINELFAGLYQTLDNAAKYTSSRDSLEEISSECLPINPYNLPFFTHPLNLDFNSLVDNIHLQTLDHNVAGFVWDSSLVATSVEHHFSDESFIVSNLPFTPEHEPHGVRLLGCLDENIAAPKGNELQSSLDKIGTGLTNETGTENLIEDIISSNDSSLVKKSINLVTDSSVLYRPERQIEGVQTSTPLSLSKYFNDCLPVNRNKKMCNSDSGVINKIKKRKVMKKDMEKRRPRDRELIQNRIKELRELIPDGSKCSIDSLLEKTVKHMLFLENISKLAEKLKQTESLEVRRADRDENKHNNQLSGNMWASQKENKTNMVPLIVENVDHPGNILIEMLCSEYDIFLEMANIMKGLQLQILKGVLDNRSGELWAHFVIERI
ncbi:transcription factor EMB1444-like isoform X2 [Carex rostrata]